MFILLISIWLKLLHPFYVSVTTIEQNAQSQSLEISCRIFFDDLEAALHKKGGTKVDLIKPADEQETDKLIAAYIAARLQIDVDGKPVRLNYLGYQIEEDAAWCYLEVPDISRFSELKIRNTILFEQFKDQSNILHVTVNGKRKSTKLDNPEGIARFVF